MNIFRLFGLLLFCSLMTHLTTDAIFGDGYYTEAKWPFRLAIAIFVFGFYFFTFTPTSRKLLQRSLASRSLLGVKIAIGQSYGDFAESSSASDPGYLRLSDAKLMHLRPHLYGSWNWLALIFRWIAGAHDEIDCIQNQLKLGDSRAAMVVSTQPLIVAAYTDELDCVALLKCPDQLTQEYGLAIGSRLVTCNLYYEEWPFENELIYGREDVYYQNFIPLIADFLTDQQSRLQELKDSMAEEEWARTWQLGQYALQHYSHFRDGSPGKAYFIIDRS